MRAFAFFLALFFLCSAALAQYEAPDPSRNVPNARVLAMGRAYMGLSNDTAAIFCNPAGLGRVTGWDMTSMSGKFMDEYSYLSFSGFYETEQGVLGVGYMTSSIAGAFTTMKDPNSSDADPVYIVDPSQPPINYANSVYIFAYGTRLSRFLRLNNWADKISLGLNAKLFSSGLAGDSISNGSASGSEIDVGIIYEPPWPWLSLGLTIQNLLPASMGGKLRYETGHEEGYPAVVEFGSAFSLVGPTDAIFRYGEHELKLLWDYYFHPTLNLPATHHIGLEYKPIKMLSVRGGLDQDVMGDGAASPTLGTVTNLTAGVGLDINGFRFDYAYHQFAGVSGVSDNYFSLSYGLTPPSGLAPIEVSNPKDALVTFARSVSIEGKVNDEKIRYLQANGEPLKMNLRAEFTGAVPLVEGRNVISLAGLDPARKEIASVKLRLLSLKQFPDVPTDFWTAVPISLLAMQDVVTGYPDGGFRPEGNITRAEMCALLMKTNELKNERTENYAKFNDIPESHWAARYIAQAAELGIVKGYADGTFRPRNSITRAEGLAMIARYAAIEEEAYLNQFGDVQSSHWAAKIIAGAQRAGLLRFLKDRPFIPNRQLTRAETVEMLYRTKAIQGLLAKGILSWETY